MDKIKQEFITDVCTMADILEKYKDPAKAFRMVMFAMTLSFGGKGGSSMIKELADFFKDLGPPPEMPDLPDFLEEKKDDKKPPKKH